MKKNYSSFPGFYNTLQLCITMHYLGKLYFELSFLISLYTGFYQMQKITRLFTAELFTPIQHLSTVNFTLINSHIRLIHLSTSVQENKQLLES